MEKFNGKKKMSEVERQQLHKERVSKKLIVVIIIIIILIIAGLILVSFYIIVSNSSEENLVGEFDLNDLTSDHLDEAMEELEEADFDIG